MIDKKYIKRTIDIAGPCIFENVMVSAVSFADTIMVGSLGAVATAGVAINSSSTWLLNSLPAFLSVGGMVIVARHIGAKENAEANHVTGMVMGTGLLFGLVSMLVMLVLSRYIPVWMGGREEILPYAVSYMRVYSLGILFHFAGLIASGLLRGAGNTKTPMLVNLAANLVNLVGNYFLIYEPKEVSVFGFSFTLWRAGLGVTGAAISTALSLSLAGIVLVTLLFCKNQIIRISWDMLFRFDPKVLKRVLSIGVPAAAERITINIGQIMFQRIIAVMGTVQVAAHYLATTAESVSYMPAGGFSVAATTLVGQSLGAEDEDDALVYGNLNAVFGLAIGLICCAIFLAVPELLLSLFSNEREVIESGAAALRVMALAEPFFCLNIVLTGILRGGGDTKAPLAASILGMWGVRIVSAYFFAYVMGWGLAGAWLSMAVDHVVRAAVLFVRFKKKKWLRMW